MVRPLFITDDDSNKHNVDQRVIFYQLHLQQEQSFKRKGYAACTS